MEEEEIRIANPSREKTPEQDHLPETIEDVIKNIADSSKKNDRWNNEELTNAIYDLVDTLRWSKKGFVEETIRETMHGKTLEEKINILDFLPALCSFIIAQQNGYDAVREVQRGIQGESESVFLDYAIKSAEENIHKETRDPSKGILHIPGETRPRRTTVTMEEQEESARLKKIYKRNGGETEFLKKIAKDSIATFDESGTMQGISREIPKEETIIHYNEQALRNLAQCLEIKGPGFILEKHIDKALSFLEESMPENVWKMFMRKIGEGNFPWENYIHARKVRNTAEKIYKKELRRLAEDAEEKNEKASAEFVIKIRNLINIYPIPEMLQKDLESENSEEAFGVAETCAMYIDFKYPESHAKLMYEELVKEREENSRSANENKHTAFLTYREAIADVTDSLNEGNAFLASNNGKNALQTAIDELASQDTRSVLTIHPINTLETTVDKKREGNFELFRELHRPEIRRQIEKDLGIPLIELTLKEQQHLLEFLSTKTKDTVRAWYALIQRHGVCAAKIFLAREESDRFANAVLEHVNQLSYNEQHAFFLEYAYIIDATQKSAKDLAELAFQEGENRKDEAEKVRQKLLKAALPSESDLQGAIHGDILKARIHETGIFALLCKEAKASGKNAELQELADMLPEYKTGIALSADEKNEMLEIARENWNVQMPDAANTVVNALAQSMENARTDFFILKRKKKILAFIRFDKKEDRTVYAGSLNVNPEARGSGIGEMALHAGIEHIAKHHRMIADVFPQLPVGTMYVEQFNCIITGTETIPLQDGTTKKRLLLERDDERYKGIKEIPANSEDIITVKNSDEIIDLVETRRAMGMIATRYIANPNGSRTLHFIAKDQHAA